MRKTALLIALGSVLSLSLSACDKGAEKPVKTAGKKSSVSKDPPTAQEDKDSPGTPMAERVAVVGLLNKRNGETRDFELKPGEAVRFGKVVLRVRACERTAPWETYPDQGAFVQLIIRERPRGTNKAERWGQVFSGWLFKENVAANVVQHPIYDVWVKECRMSFPGEEPAPGEVEKAAEPESGGAPSKKPSSRPQSPSRPAPAAEPEEEAAPDDAADEADGETTVET
jgi:hypothetical protein